MGKIKSNRKVFRVNHKLADNQKHPNGINIVVYMKSIEKILCLDQVTDTFIIYKTNGKLDSKIQTDPHKHPKGRTIFSITWSEYEQRIGGCVQGNYLSFWDLTDNF